MYQLSKNCVLRLADSAFIPMDTSNTDYQAYLAWLDQGNTALPKDPPSKAELNAVALANLAAIDIKSIRALREGDAIRLASLEVQAAAERGKLVK